MFSLPCICIIYTHIYSVITVLDFLYLLFLFYFNFTFQSTFVHFRAFTRDKISDYQCRCYNINTELLKAVDSQSCRLPKPRQAGCANNFYQILKLFFKFQFSKFTKLFLFQKSIFFFLYLFQFLVNYNNLACITLSFCVTQRLSGLLKHCSLVHLDHFHFLGCSHLLCYFIYLFILHL